MGRIMKRVGLYVFTDMVKQRVTKKREGYFDGQNYIGIRYIASQINTTQYEITYVSKDTINSVDFVLISLTSYYDIMNLINELHGKQIIAKIIIGGAGCSNISVLSEIADIAIIGRGEGIIQTILENKTKIDGVWYRETDPFLTGKLKIQPLSEFIEIDDRILGRYCEQSIGCQRKCYFCEYSWKNKHQTRSDVYHSGLADRETRIEEVDWTVYKNKDLVTAVDGINEVTRRIINKPISNKTITDKINEIYDQPRDYLSLKLYCLLGYPFEKDFKPEELLDTICSCARDHTNRLNVLMVSPHFMPMPFTPMESEPVNTINFRDKIQRYDFSKWQKHNIKVYWPYSQASSPVSAAEATVLHRATAQDTSKIKRILCSSKYKSLDGSQKIAVIQRDFGNLIGYFPEVLPYIERTHKTDDAKRIYYDRLKQIGQARE